MIDQLGLPADRVGCYSVTRYVERDDGAEAPEHPSCSGVRWVGRQTRVAHTADTTVAGKPLGQKPSRRLCTLEPEHKRPGAPHDEERLERARRGTSELARLSELVKDTVVPRRPALSRVVATPASRYEWPPMNLVADWIETVAP